MKFAVRRLKTATAIVRLSHPPNYLANARSRPVPIWISRNCRRGKNLPGAGDSTAPAHHVGAVDGRFDVAGRLAERVLRQHDIAPPRIEVICTTWPFRKAKWVRTL